MQIKLTQKIDQFTVIESFPSTSCCLQKFPPNTTENLAGWMSEEVSEMHAQVGWVAGMECREKGGIKMEIGHK